jgi:hypothetical protein
MSQPLSDRDMHVFPMSVIPKYFSCDHFFSLCFEILLTWYLVCGCIMISYRSGLRFVPVQWFFGRVVTLGLWNLAKYLDVSPLYFTMIWYIDLIFWYGCIVISYRSTLKFVPVEWFFANWFFGRVVTLGFCNLATYLVVTTFFTMIWDIDLIFGMWVYWWVIDQVLFSFRLNDFGLIYAPWSINFGQIFSCHHALRYWLDFWYLEL